MTTAEMATADGAGARDLKKAAVRSGATLLASRLLVQALQWASTLIVARLLLPSDYGVMAAAMVLIAIADILADAGLSRSLIHKASITESDIAQVATTSAAISLAIFGVLYLSAPLVGERLGDEHVTTFFRVLACSILILPIQSVSFALLERRIEFKQISIIQTSAAFLQTLLVLYLAWHGFGYWALGIGALSGRVVAAAFGYAATRWPIRFEWPRSEGSGHIKYGLSISGSAVVWMLNSNADTAIIALLLGTAALGYYSIAFQLSAIPVQRLTATVNQVAFPTYCRLRHDPERASDWVVRLMVLLAAISAPALIGLALVADKALPLLLSDKWVPSVVPFQLLSVPGCVMVIASCLPPWLNALGRPDIPFKYNLVTSLVLVPALWIGASQGGLVGVCMVWAVVFPLLFASLVHVTRGITLISLQRIGVALAPIGVAIVAMAASVLAVRMWQPSTGVAMSLVLEVAVGALVYTSVLCAVGWHSLLPSMRKVFNELRGR